VKPYSKADPTTHTVEVEGGVVFRKQQPHRCTAPSARAFDIGDVFKCSHCGSRFELTDSQPYQGGPFWKRIASASGDTI